MSWEIHTADILDWAASYNGPKFHALLCDPSYALSKKKLMVLEAIANLPSKPTNAQVIAAYHALQQWGDTGFMGKAWDTDVAFNPETWATLAEHLYSGAFGMAFASSRGWHRLAVAIEDAGMIIQPSIFGWATGQSFPKATRIDTQIDKRAGKLGEREVIGRYQPPNGAVWNLVQADDPDVPHSKPTFTASGTRTLDIERSATPLARAWAGHRYGGQVLKNALEPIIVFQKPWEGKRLDCIVETGAGSMWVDGGRIPTNGSDAKAMERCNTLGSGRHWLVKQTNVYGKYTGGAGNLDTTQGRWPSNFTLTHHPDCRRVGTRRVRGTGTAVKRNKDNNQFERNEVYGEYRQLPADDMSYADPDGYETVTAWDCVPECPVRRLGEMSGEREVSGTAKLGKQHKTGWAMFGNCRPGHASKGLPNDTGTAARFYFQADWSYEVAERLATADPVMYCAKASRAERDAGLEEWAAREVPYSEYRENYKDTKDFVTHYPDGSPRPVNKVRNPHPTVKPIALIRWLATLLLPPPEYAPRRLLIPFSGSGSEGIGAGLAGWEEMVLIDLLAENNEIAEARLGHWLNGHQLELL